MNSTCSQSFLNVTNIKSDPVREALWRTCFIPLSVTITDAMFGSEWSLLQDYVWVPDTFPYICSTFIGRRVEECGVGSWGEDLRLTNCSASVIFPTLIHFGSTQATAFSSTKLRVTQELDLQQAPHLQHRHLNLSARLLQSTGAETASGRLMEAVKVPKDATW